MYLDRRDAAALFGSMLPAESELDEENMTLQVTLDVAGAEKSFTFPCKYDVCDLCDGKGRHVNPSIDAHGISPDEFEDDPEFEEDYFGGVYDIPCNQCRGKRVQPVIDREAVDPEALALFDKWVEEEAYHRLEAEAELSMERRFGC